MTFIFNASILRTLWVQLIAHMLIALSQTEFFTEYFFRIIVGSPLKLFVVVIIKYLQAGFHVATMTNLVLYVLLKFGYFKYFDTINNILDETILKIMKAMSIIMGCLSIGVEIIWKVRWQVSLKNNGCT